MSSNAVPQPDQTLEQTPDTPDTAAAAPESAPEKAPDAYAELPALFLAPGDLVPDSENLRLHDKRNMEAIESSVEETGFMRSIVMDENNRVIAGNGTLEVARKKGARVLVVDVDDPNTLVAVRRHGLSEKDKTRAGLHDNRSSELGKWNKKEMGRLVKERPEQMLLSGVFTPKEQQKLLMEQAEAQPLAPGGADDDADTPETANAASLGSSIRAVQLFYTTTTQPEFMKMVRALDKEIYKKGNVTNAVYAIVAAEYDALMKAAAARVVGEDDATDTATDDTADDGAPAPFAIDSDDEADAIVDDMSPQS
jgi:hypothetical protein